MSLNPNASLDTPPRAGLQTRATSGANLFTSATRPGAVPAPSSAVFSAPREAEYTDGTCVPPEARTNDENDNDHLNASAAGSVPRDGDRNERRDSQLVADDDDDDNDGPDGDFMYIPLSAPPGVASDTVKRTNNNNNNKINEPIVASVAVVVVTGNAPSDSVSTPPGRLLPDRTKANARPSSGEYVFVGNDPNDSALLGAFNHQASAPQLNVRPVDGSYIAVAIDPAPSDPQYEHVPNILKPSDHERDDGQYHLAVVDPPPEYEFVAPETMQTGTIPFYQPMSMVSESSDALVLSDEEGGGGDDDDAPAPPVGKSRSRPMLQRTRADKQLVYGTSHRSTSSSRLVVTVVVPSANLTKRILCDPQTTCGAALEKMVGSFKTAGLVGGDFNARDFQLARDPIAFAVLLDSATMGASLGITHGSAPSPLFVVEKSKA